MERKKTVTKSLIDKSGLKGFASAIRQKLTPPVAEGVKQEDVDEAVQSLMSKIREQLEKGDISGQELLRAKLAEIILPGAFIKGSDGKFALDKKKVKDWAYALGQTIGLLAGLTIQKDRISGAIDEIAKESKTVAERMDAITGSLQDLNKPQAPAIPADMGDRAKAEAQKRMVQDLEDQASLETDPAGKAALESMAKRLKKEMELASEHVA